MFAFLRGKPAASGTDYIVIDVGGVGYKVFVPTPVIGKVADNKTETVIYTYLHVREDAMQLFGFLQETDREVFELLIQVSGIGPKVALAVMSAMPVPSFVSAVVHEQVNILTQIPGVGKKTAQRVIIELKDKLGKLGSESVPELQDVVGGGTGDESADALNALLTLGYNPVEAKKVLGKIVRKAEGSLKTEDIVKQALKELGRF